jgi:chemotaxis protein methyltransferase CheR
VSRPASPARAADRDRNADSIRPLGPDEFDQIRRLAHRVFGLDLKPGKEDLVSARLGKLVRGGGFRTFQDYYRHIVGDTTGESLARMIDALTTNHTSFMRESDHFEFLKREALPNCKASECVEIWSAACSTGEEVWTLAAVLSDVLGPRRYHVVASDISTQALRAARQGLYPAERCAGIPSGWLGRHFETPDRGATWRVSDGLRAHATFRRVNLVEPYNWPRRFPVIFCRNVMIYFDAPTQERVVQRLCEWLEPGGYLFVGHAESLTRITHPLQYVKPAVYRKPPEQRGRWIRSS